MIGAFRNFELNQMALVGRPGRAFFVEEEGIPPYDELILVAHQKRIDDPALRDFVDAVEDGVRYLVGPSRRELATLFIRRTGGA